jgi:hypothetical protein
MATARGSKAARTGCVGELGDSVRMTLRRSWYLGYLVVKLEGQEFSLKDEGWRFCVKREG